MLLNQVGVVLSKDGPVVRDEPGEASSDSGDFRLEQRKTGRDLSRTGHFITDYLTEKFHQPGI